MDYEHAGARRIERIVIGDEAFERGITVLVFDGLRLDLREGGVGEKSERDECELRFHALKVSLNAGLRSTEYTEPTEGEELVIKCPRKTRKDTKGR